MSRQHELTVIKFMTWGLAYGEATGVYEVCCQRGFAQL